MIEPTTATLIEPLVAARANRTTSRLQAENRMASAIKRCASQFASSPAPDAATLDLCDEGMDHFDIGVDAFAALVAATQKGDAANLRQLVATLPDAVSVQFD